MYFRAYYYFGMYFILIELYLINNVVLVLGIQHSDLDIYIWVSLVA